MIKYLTAGVIFLTGLTATCQDSASFRGDPQHSGVYAGHGLAKYNKVKWKFHTNGEVVSSPAVVNDTVYFGSADRYLYAVGLNDGVLRWKFQTQSRISSSPAVAAGVVFFGSYDGNFYAVDANTGKLRWKFATAGERRYSATHLHGAQPVTETMPDPFDVYLSSPAIANGVVYFGSGDDNVYALNADTGALRWKVKTGDVVHASPAIWNGNVYVGSWDSYFYAIDAATGKTRWRFKTGDDLKIHNQVGIQASAAVVGGVVYFGSRDSHLYAVDAVTGQKKWAFSTGHRG
jgi:outer membrane protein assembly factor BamB